VIEDLTSDETAGEADGEVDNGGTDGTSNAAGRLAIDPCGVAPLRGANVAAALAIATTHSSSAAQVTVLTRENICL
jgi:hypothetical protein